MGQMGILHVLKYVRELLESSDELSRSDSNPLDNCIIKKVFEKCQMDRVRSYLVVVLQSVDPK